MIEVTSKTLDTDIKSIKKAARKGIEKELIKRVNEILLKKEIDINIENKIIWRGNPIARLKKEMITLIPKLKLFVMML